MQVQRPAGGQVETRWRRGTLTYQEDRDPTLAGEGPYPTRGRGTPPYQEERDLTKRRKTLPYQEERDPCGETP